MGLPLALLLLVGPLGKFASANQNHYPDLGNDMSSVCISVLVSQMSFHQETSGGVAKSQLFFQANHLPKHDVESCVLGPIHI